MKSPITKTSIKKQNQSDSIAKSIESDSVDHAGILGDYSDIRSIGYAERNEFHHLRSMLLLTSTASYKRMDLIALIDGIGAAA
jgi:hypothetical protein